MFDEPHSLPLVGFFNHWTGWTGEPNAAEYRQRISLPVKPPPDFLSLVVEQPFDPRSLFTLQDTAVPWGVSSSGVCSSSKEVDFIEDRGVFDEELRTSTSNFSHRYGM